MSVIGVLDSGLGGMILLEHLIRRYPSQDFLFLADQIHSPYGQKSEDELIEIVNQNIKWLKQQGAESILFACNTISALDPSKITNALPIERVVEPTCRLLLKDDVKRVLVCATDFTVKSGIYEKTLHSLDPQLKIDCKALPYLCTDVEELAEDETIYCKLERDLSEYKGNVDAVVLGCTHYPACRHLFERLLETAVYDSCSIELQHSTKGTGTVRYFTTGSRELFEAQCSALFHKKIQCTRVEL